MITLEQLQRVLPNNKSIEEWYQAIADNLPEFSIDTSERIAAFLAQCSHESTEFTRLTENLNYKWESLRKVFPKYFLTDDIAKKYAHNQEAIASRVYGNRMGNGSEGSNDGWKYKGRGVIQITGKNNYQELADYLEMDLDDVSSYLETFDGAIISACWYWEKNNLNRFSDRGDMRGLTKAINGGYIGLDDRIEKYERILGIIG
ncbi:glycoside hydrolase family 19 protein [Candidatus Dojkabacteria bacterium]|jgi:putative chitinase|nr:glycoside hydrolase family 19 protein [Candidatus Dojkabacteria bacterium]